MKRNHFEIRTLVFRSQVAYRRYWEGRGDFGTLVTCLRSFALNFDTGIVIQPSAPTGSPTQDLRVLLTLLSKASPEKLWNLCRHIVASVYILYFQLAGGASDGGKQVTESEWQVLLQTGLISQVIALDCT